MFKYTELYPKDGITRPVLQIGKLRFKERYDKWGVIIPR